MISYFHVKKTKIAKNIYKGSSIVSVLTLREQNKSININAKEFQLNNKIPITNVNVSLINSMSIVATCQRTDFIRLITI